MPQFRKKPVVVDAMQYNGTRRAATEIAKWADIQDSNKYIQRLPDGGLGIYTLEGVMRASSGDWVIKGARGEFYPCKPDIFESTYEAI